MANGYSLIEAEDKHIVRPRTLYTSRPGLWPSEASVEYHQDGRKIVFGKCMRAAWYRSMKTPAGPPSPGLMMKAELGKAAEKSAIERWKQQGLWVDNSVKFFNRDFALSGEVDAVISNPETSNLIAYEIKSYYGHYANQQICGAVRAQKPGAPKIDQFLQASIYAYEYLHEIEEFRMYYIERGDGHRVEFKVGMIEEEDTYRPYWQQVPGPYWSVYREAPVVQPYTMRDIYSRFEKLLHLLRTKTLPAKDYTEHWDDETIEWKYKIGELGKTKYDKWKKNRKTILGDWNCSYCNYREQCKLDSA